MGGTFDPIHHGHLQLALSAQEQFSFDKVLLCPAYVSPFKTSKMPHVTPFHRLAMLKIALEELPGFFVCEEEIHHHTPSFTIDTLRRLQQQSPEAELSIILGEDQLGDFSRWKDFQNIITMFAPKVGSRLGAIAPKKSLGLEDKDFFCMPNLEISSTFLRERLYKRLYCKHLMPPKVVDYILEHKLYLTR